MLYMIRRHLGYGVREWHALPWQEKEIYLEGLRSEFGKSEWQDTVSEPGESYDVPQGGNSLEALADMGFTVREVV